jgi:uncharacterized protein (TIGR03086 family)
VSIALLTLINNCLDWADGVVARIRDEQRDAATPCPEFTVDSLMAHLVDGLAWYGELPAGGSVDPREVHGPDVRQVGYVDAFRSVHATIRRNWTAERLAGTFPMGGTEVTGAGITEYMIVEALGHGWDLATATGQPVRVDPDVAEAALAVAHGLGEEVLRSPGMMAAAVPVDADAPAIDRFAAYLGREPAPARKPG